jgi:hypothetical protein
VGEVDLFHQKVAVHHHKVKGAVKLVDHKLHHLKVALKLEPHLKEVAPKLVEPGVVEPQLYKIKKGIKIDSFF